MNFSHSRLDFILRLCLLRKSTRTVMDPLSATASVLTVVEAACSSSKFICTFFQSISHASDDIHHYRAILQALQESLTQLRTVCTLTDFSREHAAKLLSKANEYFNELKAAEEHISLIDRSLQAGRIRRTWTLVQWTLLKGEPWVDRFFKQMTMWTSMIKCDLILIQM